MPQCFCCSSKPASAAADVPRVILVRAELLTWLGVMKVSCLVGVDFGGCVAGEFKRTHKARCAHVCLHYRRLDVDEKEYKVSLTGSNR